MPRALARVLVAGGGALAQPPECRATKKKRLKDAKAAAEEADIRVFQTHNSGRYDTGGFASLHPRLRATRAARAFDLSGRAAVFLPRIFSDSVMKALTRICAQRLRPAEITVMFAIVWIANIC